MPSRPEGDRRQDGELGGGVVPLHVGRRVGLGEALPLRLRERAGELPPLLGHLREDVVRRAVEDADDLLDPVRGQRFPQRLDHRQPPADAGFEPQVHPGPFGLGEQFRAVLRQELLVGGDHALAAPDRVQEQGAGRLDPAHHLHDHVHPIVGDHRRRIRGEHPGLEAYFPGLRRMRGGDAREAQADPGPPADVCSVGLQQADHGAAHSPAPEQPDPEVGGGRGGSGLGHRAIPTAASWARIHRRSSSVKGRAGGRVVT